MGSPPLAEATDLIRLVLGPGELDNLNPAQLVDERLRFYAVAWERGDAAGPVAFVSEYDSTQVLRKPVWNVMQFPRAGVTQFPMGSAVAG